MKLDKQTLLFKGPHSLKNQYKKSLKLSQNQKDIIVGTLLGDAHLEPRGKNVMYRYCFSQKEGQREYVVHVYSNFEAWCSQEPQSSITGTDIYGELTRSVYFKTCTHPSFAFYANQFYTIDSSTTTRRKVVPKLLHKWLNARVLAYWFMDDGSTDRYGYRLNTQNFTLKEQEELADALGRQFKLKINIQKDRIKYRLYIPASSRDSFIEIIKPFILPSFEYKLMSP